MSLIDAHLDLSWNALSWDRDQTQSIAEIRAREGAMAGKSRGRCTVSLPEMRRSGIGVCLATVLARSRPGFTPPKTHERTSADHFNQEICHATAVGQMTYYKLMEARGQMTPIRTAGDLQRVWDLWQKDVGGQRPIGYVLSMEGCDPIVSPQQAQWWWDQGLRTACLAHYGQSAYAMGTGGDGPLTPAGRELVREFNRLGMVLDLVHTADLAFAQALEIYQRPVFVSHGNCRALVPGDRQISDEQLKQVAARDGVVGVVLDAWMLLPNYKIGETPNDAVTLRTLAQHIDHICQVTGSVRHAAIGSDLDGGFGTEQGPCDLDTIADLHKLRSILGDMGYKQADIDAIFFGNWLRFFGESLPRG